MKIFFTSIWVIICLAILIVGRHYWNEKTAVPSRAASPSATTAPAAGKQTVQPNNDAILAMAQNWPDTARQQFEQSLKQNKPFKILFVGSPDIGNQDKGMLKDVIPQLTSAFGGHVTISIHNYNLTSKQFVANNDQSEIAAEKAQMLVLEPFILNDNGNVPINDAINNWTKIIGDVKAANPDTTFILQPSYPLFGAKFYPGQVAKLKQYAEQNKLTYLDHWTAWPASTNKELTSYLLPDASAPSDKGNQVWSQYLINYFIHK